MKRFIKAMAAIMLMFAVVCAACTKDEVEDANGSGNGGEPQFFISVSAHPAFGGTVSGGGGFEKEQSCTLTATPAADYVFKNWTENGNEVSSDDSYTFTVTSDRDLVANFIYNGGAQIQYFTVSVSANPVEGGEVLGGGTYREGKPCTIKAVPKSVYTFINWSDENGDLVSTDVSFTFTVEGDRNLVANFSHNIIGGHEYVDLGLPSGILWAACNIGSDNPEEYGDYFAWGETEIKDAYDVANYKYSEEGFDDLHPRLTKYCNIPSYGYNGFTDDLTTLLPEDDAAIANWGNDWRMPTMEEWQELYNKTTLKCIQQNGVYGCLFTASNGNSLFLPAAGHRWDDILSGVGYEGSYWSSSLFTDFPYGAWYFDLDSGYTCVSYYGRFYGFSVRPVHEN